MKTTHKNTDLEVISPEDIAMAPPKSVSRRGMLSTMGAMGAGIALPASVGGLSLLVAGSAHAASTYNSPTHHTTSSGTVVDEGGTTWIVNAYTSAGGEHIVLMKKQNIFDHNYCAIRHHTVSGVLKVSYYDTCSATLPTSTANTLTVTYGGLSSEVNASLFGNADGGRRLTDIDWALPAGATTAATYSLGSNSSEQTIYAIKYLSGGIYYVKAEIILRAGSAWGWSSRIGFSGAKLTTFLGYVTDYQGKQKAYKTAHTLQLATTAAVAAAVCAGAFGAFFSAGLSLSVTGSVIVASLAANSAATLAASSAAIALAASWSTLVSWTEGQTGIDLAR